jgi:hypothetical protein
MHDNLYSYDRRNGFELVVEPMPCEDKAYVGMVYYQGKLKYKTPLRFNPDDCRDEILKDLEAYLENFGCIAIDK